MSGDLAHLADMVASARLARRYVQGLSREQFAADTQVQDAVVRRIELIGEAANRVSQAGRQQWPWLPWRQMVGMRNLMIHRYETVDLNIVWDTVRADLPDLIQRLEDILGHDPGR